MLALVALQMHWISALSSNRYVSKDCLRGEAQHTEPVITVAGDGNDFRADLSTLLGNVALLNLLRRNKGGQGSDDGELLEEHFK